MRRVCFIGNSHVGSIKKAVDDLKGSDILKSVDVSIFGSHRDSLKTLDVSDGYIFSDDEFVQNNFHWTSGGSTKVKVSDYDEIFFVLGRSIFDLTNFRAGNDIPFLSSDLAMKLLNSTIDAWPIRLAKNTAKANDNVQVTHVGIPFLSAEAPEAKLLLAKFDDPKSKIFNRIKYLRTLMEEKFSEVSKNNFRVMQPLATPLEEHGLFTQHIFCQGSTRLSSEMNVIHPTDDYAHMNAYYGRLLLEHLLSQKK